jgi:SAM-dependent methyltransferase
VTLISALHKLVSHPWVYDRTQELVGVHLVHQRISTCVSGIESDARVVDIGGGTGAIRKLFPKGCTYICLDVELPKLIGFRNKVEGGPAVQADAARMPIAPGSVDVVVCTAVAHHLTNQTLDDVMSEAARILKPNGKLIFLDPIVAPRRIIGRIMWSLDRGSFPRSADALRQALSMRFTITYWEGFAVLHEYVLGVCVPRLN